MVATLVSWVYIIFISFVYGLATINLLQKIYKPTNRITLPFSVIAMLGMAVISVLTAYFSLFMEISVKANLTFLLGALILLIMTRLDYGLKTIKNFLLEFVSDKSNILYILFVCLFALLLSFRSSVPPFAYDTGLYHSQAVQWIEKYPVIAGLGNLHSRFAYNSIWLLLSALFDFSFLFQQPLHSLNSLTLMIAAVFSLSATKEILRGEVDLPILFRFLFLFPLLEMSYDTSVSSLSTDLPVLVLTFLILYLLFRYIKEYETLDTRILSVLITILILFVIAVKLSAIPLILVIPYLIYKQHRKGCLINICVIPITTLLVIAPHLLRNIILSGYLIYPLDSIDFFQLEWKIPIEYSIDEKRWIESWARIPKKNPNEVLNGGMFVWLPTWFTVFKSTLEFKCLAVAVTIFLSVNILCLKQIIPQIQKYKYIYFVILSCLTFWFFSAPDIRFGYGFIWALITILFATSMIDILKKIRFS